MTDRTKHHIRRGWDATKTVTILGSIVLLMHQAVDLRGKVLAQQESQAVVASNVASMVRDISRLSIENAALKIRVSRLERPLRIARAGSLHGTATPDTVAARSPGLVGAAVDLVSAPFRFLGAVFRGR